MPSVCRPISKWHCTHRHLIAKLQLIILPPQLLLFNSMKNKILSRLFHQVDFPLASHCLSNCGQTYTHLQFPTIGNSQSPFPLKRRFDFSSNAARPVGDCRGDDQIGGDWKQRHRGRRRRRRGAHGERCRREGSVSESPSIEIRLSVAWPRRRLIQAPQRTDGRLLVDRLFGPDHRPRAAHRPCVAIDAIQHGAEHS